MKPEIERAKGKIACRPFTEAKESDKKVGGRSRHLRNPKSTGRAARGQPFPGIAMRDQKR
ncbi:hypothetical protein [Burkholderia cenocepacia]|uniref:hypothetical protein n=1 Tax=Burkholderia cenocepacia TaxID=95486 RepID=UPI001F098D67|nr:hypothetical protein [Burkholderia cenocepacia]MCO1396568.1 hypothetical protein [Burkholderia cenocepacia]MCO1409142.1 hypothetical protein [Burkholderia cenocepacia]MDN7640927.1 hypothetical protein [Burkholderia cenocepacia]UQN91886.1 hypothetical protein L0Z06_14265 [Burkholderia cenocepacia]UQN99035.1 hypothetical protein L0Z39_16055 [Burkholderia cenocepacia]